MTKRKRLEAWANEVSGRVDPYATKKSARLVAQTWQEASRVAVHPVECDEPETVVSKAELRALRAVAKAAREWAKWPSTQHAMSVLLDAVERLKGTKR